VTVVRAWADLALRSALGAALAIFLLLAVLPRTGLYRTETVLSGSMKPDFNSGDLVIVTPEASRDIRVGQVISYRIPMFKYNGMLVGYAAFKNHCSLFPTGSGVLDQFEQELKGYRTSKGTIQFPSDKPLPDALVKKIVRARVKENKEWD